MCKKMISVVIPMYNRSDKICRALDSVFSQTALSAIGEIIVVDDGSTDNSIATVQEYSIVHNSISIVILPQENHGPSHARNRGMATAQYKYIAFLDSDDEWLPHKTADQLQVFSDHNDACFVGGNAQPKPMKILFKPINSLYKANLTDLCIKSFPVTPSVLMKKEVFDEIGGFDETIRYYEDCDYFQRICAAGYGYYFVPTQLVVCDRGKKPFGDTGLSANLKQAHIDSLVSLKKLLKSRKINRLLYCLLYMFYTLKYFRRILLSKY